MPLANLAFTSTLLSNSPVSISTTIKKSLSFSKLLITNSFDSGKTTGCMVGLTAKVQDKSRFPFFVEMPASPPFRLSHAMQVSNSGTFTGGAIIPPPSLSKGSITDRLDVERSTFKSLCLPVHGAGLLQLK